jgi:hypothetical protein
MSSLRNPTENSKGATSWTNAANWDGPNSGPLAPLRYSHGVLRGFADRGRIDPKVTRFPQSEGPQSPHPASRRLLHSSGLTSTWRALDPL